MSSRILFLCARDSSRSLLAASMLANTESDRYDVWSTPTQDEHSRMLAEQVLQEQHIPVLIPEHFIQPTLGMRWDEGIVLCSGAADT